MSPDHRSSSRRDNGTARSIKIATLYRVSGRWRREVRVPYIRLSGRWLDALGFVAESRITVRGEPGRLIITVQSQELGAQPTAG
jgi:hypothetical protein